MTNAEIAVAFDHVADLLEFKGENPFRVRAYRNAARTIGDLPRQVSDMLAAPDAQLTGIAGIGKDLAEKIQTLVRTRQFPMLEELRAEIPDSVLAMLRIPGLGPKRAAILFHELDVKTLDQLRAACQSHRVQDLKGFGEKMEATILEGIGIAAEVGKRFLWAEADQLVQDIYAYMRSAKAVQAIEAAGSYRRKKETVGDLDFLVVADDAAAVMDHFAAYPGRAANLARGDTKMAIRLTTGLQIDLRVVPSESFGAALQYFTGSQAHNIILRGLAKDRKMKINEYGVFKGEKRIAGRTEEEVYAALDLPCFPPEIREARFEFQWAEKGPLPELITLDDIQGDLHMHSTWSDGLASFEEMIEAAKARGRKYVAITDHSKRVTMAGGLDEQRLRQQWAQIDAYNAHHRGITVLKGVEMDILEQGEMDVSDAVLAEADWVVASVHFGQKQSRERITQRIINALENPYVSAIAHPTGRLLTRRKPYEVDLEAVLNAAREHGKCLELNAHPSRLDLDDVACTMAQVHGVPVVISTDAHSVDGLDAMRYGVQQARRGGLTAADVANTRTWKQLKKRLGRS
jgi:DNA polymerase (family 10)